MDNLSDEIKLELLCFLDISSLISLGQTSKQYSLLIHNDLFWKLKKNIVQKQFPIALGAYFSYNPKAYYSKLYTKEQAIDFSYTVYKDLVSKISNPRSIVKSSLDSYINQSLNGMLKYEDELF